MKKIIYILVFLPIISFGQSQNRPNINWQQIKSKNFTVIFPSEIENYAKKTILLLDTVYHYDTKTFPSNKPKHINLLLYNRTSYSNAYAALAPRRMVWYTTPPQTFSLTLSSWEKTLAIHEFRHVTQYAKSKDGFTKLISLFFGEYGHAALENWTIPNWFMEGDAVFNETKFSNSGRGRMPPFSLPIRTILLSNQKISYEKALFRSYKTFYPNHYYLGYHLTAYVNKHFGEEIWDKILSRSSMFSFWPYTFERSLKKYTGSNLRKTYKKAMIELDSVWTSQLAKTDTIKTEKINKKKKRSRTNYFNLQYIANDTILAVKNGFDHRTTLIYVTTDGKEKKIREIRNSNISYGNKKIVWAESSQHIRYGEEGYSDIVLYNLNNKKLKYITKKKNYLSPNISADGEKITAVELTKKLDFKIHIFDTNGKIIFSKKIENATNVAQPIWTSDNKNIIFLKTSYKGESMEILDTETGKISVLIAPQWTRFENHRCSKNYVFFDYDYSGITNIYALDLTSKQIFRVTSRPFAASQATIDNKQKYIYFSDYQLLGWNINRIPFNKNNWIEISNVRQTPVNYFYNNNTKSTIENINTKPVLSDTAKLKTTAYKHYKHTLNFHSMSFTKKRKNYGIKAFSTDIMNTMELQTAILGNLAMKNLMIATNIKYKKYFPIFNFGFQTGQNGIAFDKNMLGSVDSVENWYENNINLKISVPLNLSKGNFIRKITPQISGNFSTMSNFSGKFYDKLSLKFTEIFIASANLKFINYRLKGYRDILPKFGQALNIGASYAPDLFGLSGYRFFANATLFIPGILKHDGCKIAFDYENKNFNSSYYFAANRQLPRGYNIFAFNRMYKATAEYQIPILYPDINIPYILYIKRVRMNLFYDFAHIDTETNSGLLSSAGAELLFDFNIIRLNFFSFHAGVRYSYRINDNKFDWDFIMMDINLNNL